MRYLVLFLMMGLMFLLPSGDRVSAGVEEKNTDYAEDCLDGTTSCGGICFYAVCVECLQCCDGICCEWEDCNCSDCNCSEDCTESCSEDEDGNESCSEDCSET